MTDLWPTIGSPFADQAEDWVLERTVPLYAQTRTGNPVLEGSAVLLRIGELAFLVTAGHVIAGVVKDGDRRLLVGTVPGQSLVSLEGLDVAVSTDKNDVDIAFLRLPEGLAAEIGAHKRFLGLDRVDTARAPAVPGWYMIIGFPRQHTTRDAENRTVNSGALCMHTVLREDAAGLALGTSIGLAFERYGKDANGDALETPALPGISGCGIWCVSVSKDEVARGAWTTDSIFLAGIEHTVLGQTTIKGTLAFHVESAIRHRYPDLREQILATRGPSIPGRQLIFGSRASRPGDPVPGT